MTYVIYMRCSINFKNLEYNCKCILAIWAIAFLNANSFYFYLQFFGHSSSLLPVYIGMIFVRTFLIYMHLFFYTLIRVKGGKREAFYYFIYHTLSISKEKYINYLVLKNVCKFGDIRD